MTDGDIKAIEEDVISEDSFAEFFGTSVFSITGHRQRRNLGLLRGWPKRLMLLHNPARAETTLKEFRRDVEDRAHILTLQEEMTKGCKEVMDRHILEKRATNNTFVLQLPMGG